MISQKIITKNISSIRFNLLLIVILAIQYLGCTHIKPTAAQLSARMSINNAEDNQTVFYLTKPTKKSFAIAVLCEGSTNPDDIESVWWVYQFEQFNALKEMGIGILAIEKDGIDAEVIDKERFFANYTRTRRFRDHVAVIDHLLKNPPDGFNGRLIFIGASEGGPLANQLSIYYPQTLATINWSGADDKPWADDLWDWGVQMRKWHPFLSWLYSLWNKVPKTRKEFDKVMAEAVKDPSDKRWFLGMTYRYHGDAMKIRALDYSKIHAPMLMVCGTKDSLIDSCDSFAAKAKNAHAPITYWRIEGMEHSISKNKENLIHRSFEWLKHLLEKQSTQ